MATPETLADEVKLWRSRAGAYPAARFSGRGVVICAGGTRYFTNAWVLIRILRRTLGCRLPIQVWHFGRAEMSDGMRHMLEEQGVEVVDAETVLACHPARICGGWPLKPYAIAHSRFREVIYLDADTVPFVDPAVIFDWQDYAESGALFWPDVIDIRAENPVWRIVGVAAERRTALETGVLAVDKARTWQALQLTVLLNENWEWLYDMLYGDKDTFLVAWRYLDIPFGLIGHAPTEANGALLQRDPAGKIFLEHRTLAKLALKAQNVPVSRASFDAACQEALAGLRRDWDGTIFHAPQRSEAARAMETRLAEIGKFHYCARGDAAREIELRSGNRIRDGRGEMDKHWAVVDRGTELALEFYSDARASVRLHPSADGIWRGQGLGDAPYDAALAARGDAPLWLADPERDLERDAARLIDQILDASLMGAGYVPALADELCAACRWSARINKLVAHALRVALDRRERPIPEPWRDRLQTLAVEIAEAEEVRLANAEHESEPVQVIDPDHYERQL